MKSPRVTFEGSTYVPRCKSVTTAARRARAAAEALSAQGYARLQMFVEPRERTSPSFLKAAGDSKRTPAPERKTRVARWRSVRVEATLGGAPTWRRSKTTISGCSGLKHALRASANLHYQS